MEAEKEKVCEGAEYAFITDIRITLECLHEAYQMEGDLIKSGKNIYATMIYPFIRMIKEQCSIVLMNSPTEGQNVNEDFMPIKVIGSYLFLDILLFMRY